MHQPPQPARLFHQRLGGHQKAQAHPRRERLRQRAEIDHPPVPVARFQRRFAGEGDLALVVVLDDQEIVLRGAREDLVAARPGHHHHRGAMRARCQQRQIEPLPRGDPRTFLVDRQRHALRAGHLEDEARIRVARHLAAHALARPRQKLREQVEPLLRAERDQDLLGPRIDAALGQDAGADLLDQHRIVIDRAIRRPPVERGPPQCIARRIAPRVEREQPRIDLPEDERIGIVLPVQRLADMVELRGGDPDARLPIDHGGASDALPFPLPAGGDEQPAARLRLEIAARDQLVVDGGGGVARDAQLLGQRARGQHLLPRRHLARVNRRDQRLTQLALQRLGAVTVDGDGQAVHDLAP